MLKPVSAFARECVGWGIRRVVKMLWSCVAMLAGDDVLVSIAGGAGVNSVLGPDTALDWGPPASNGDPEDEDELDWGPPDSCIHAFSMLALLELWLSCDCV